MNPPVIAITGASRGIGLATAQRFARSGHRVLLAAREPTALEAAAETLRAAGADVQAISLDLAEIGAGRKLVDAAVARFGRLDVLVNNAGAAPLSRVADMTDEDFEHVQALNVRAVFATTRAAWPIMQAQGSGVIVNISSAAAFDPFPGFSVYGASKAWVNVFSQALAVEGARDAIRIYAVAPGAVETQMLRSNFPRFPAEKTLAPDDVAAKIEELCADTTAARSGQTVVISR